jgi:hypothetical protein
MVFSVFVTEAPSTVTVILACSAEVVGVSGRGVLIGVEVEVVLGSELPGEGVLTPGCW